jgi:GNAT superfamily N-acetyltransferase
MPLIIRSIDTSDEARVRAFLEGLSAESRWLRYHQAMPVVKDWMVDDVVRADHVRHGALVALRDDRIVGIAEWARFDPDDPTADIAVVVAEPCRRTGVAGALLRRLARDARSHGVDAFSGSILTVNRPTIALVQRVAPTHTTTFDGGTVEVRIPLRASA